jgi:hypothetical protein
VPLDVNELIEGSKMTKHLWVEITDEEYKTKFKARIACWNCGLFKSGDGHTLILESCENLSASSFWLYSRGRECDPFANLRWMEEEQEPTKEDIPGLVTETINYVEYDAFKRSL